MVDLESELTRHLAPLEAPGELWACIIKQPEPQPRGWVLWPVVAAALVIGYVDLLWQVPARELKTPAKRAAVACLSCHTAL